MFEHNLNSHSWKLSFRTVCGFLCLLFFVSICSVLPARAEVIQLGARSGDVFELKARKIQPGEPLVLTWMEKKSELAIIDFRGEHYELKARSGQADFLLLGLDLGVKAGRETLSISLWSGGSEKDQIQADLEIMARDFPKKKLTVDPKYVHPPREVQERIKREAEILAQIYGQTSPEWLAQGKFELPCAGQLAPNFGQQRIYNNVPRSIHAGVDIAIASGQPIRAANDGRVVLASNLYFSGNTVIIDHGLGLYTVYCHMSKLLVKRGAMVRQGEIIGLAGSTGLSTGPHLHWAAKINEARIDPLALLEIEF
ncbi:MAG TPA: M23 family metallopeptidase [Candidatus Saccharicenans sp.]|nr:M23 family metallopeptidase [Candidatus Saccharicenans sp.]HOL44844.1 M23 family metallopeptidase [Candidatus Saccharicenans sp.]HPP23212.1 M23 family metallopeptidase [Candidatus Saccharicenans sp.]